MQLEDFFIIKKQIEVKMTKAKNIFEINIFKKFFITAILLSLFSSVLVSCNNTTPKRSLINPEHPQNELDIWNGEIDESWFDEGANEFHISTAQQLAGLGSLVNTNYDNFYEKKVFLDCDINLNSIDEFENWETEVPSNNWIPIGFIGEKQSQYFCGVFDGQGHSINGLYINEKSSFEDNKSFGLFGAVKMDSPDSGLRLTNIEIRKSFIDLSLIEKDYIIGSAVGYICGGGVFGKTNGLCNIFSECDITCPFICDRVGGISGFSQTNLFNCAYCGTFKLNQKSSNIGGVASGGAIPAYVVNSYTITDFTGIDNAKSLYNGVITSQCIPVCSYFLNNNQINTNRHGFGSARRLEKDETHLSFGNGRFSSFDSQVTIMPVEEPIWADNSNICGDNRKPVDYESYDSLLEALNSFSFENVFTKNKNDDVKLRKWKVLEGYNNNFPILDYEE